MFGKSSHPVIHIYKSCGLHSLSSLKPENNLGKCHISCYEFGGSCLLSTIFELFRILILENSKPSMVLHVDVLDSQKVNRNRAPYSSSLGDSESWKFCLNFENLSLLLFLRFVIRAFLTFFPFPSVSQFWFKLFLQKAGNLFFFFFSFLFFLPS